MDLQERVNILVVDDQPAKLMSYEAVLSELGETLIRANSAREALQILLKTEIAVILVDVCMPELDGFQLAHMIRDHPRFSKTAIVFISAVQLDDLDRIRGYQLGAVDYVPVPIIPELLRAKVKVFAELYRKTRQLQHLNDELERRVIERTSELEAANTRLQLAIEVAQLGMWDWDLRSGKGEWSDRFYSIFDYRPGEVAPTLEAWGARLHPEDAPQVKRRLLAALEQGTPFHEIYRCVHADGSIVWCEARGRQESDSAGNRRSMMGVVMDISGHKLAAERQRLMLQELHHRVKNSLANVMAIASMTARTAPDIAAFQASFSNRIQSLGRTHTMLVASNWQRINIMELMLGELGGFDSKSDQRFTLVGPSIDLPADVALSLGLVVHELATNAAKYGALSVPEGSVDVNWLIADGGNGPKALSWRWMEKNGPAVRQPERRGFGSTLLERVFAAQSGSQASTQFLPDGLQFHASIPLFGIPSEASAATQSLDAE